MISHDFLKLDGKSRRDAVFGQIIFEFERVNTKNIFTKMAIEG
jgi:hypothetical protein